MATVEIGSGERDVLYPGPCVTTGEIFARGIEELLGRYPQLEEGFCYDPDNPDLELSWQEFLRDLEVLAKSVQYFYREGESQEVILAKALTLVRVARYSSQKPAA